MSNRHLARTIAMQSLYQWDFLDFDEEKLPEIVEFNREEFAPDFDDGGFVQELVDGVVNNRSDIDALLIQFAPEWPVEAMTIIDRNILRLGTYELRWSETVPSKVAINEAIELAKGFGGEASGRFVNGVLGAIFKDMIVNGKEKEIDKAQAKKPKAEPEVESETESEQKTTETTSLPDKDAEVA